MGSRMIVDTGPLQKRYYVPSRLRRKISRQKAAMRGQSACRPDEIRSRALLERIAAEPIQVQSPAAP